MRKHHRNASVAPASTPNSAINVTPMVDVVLVLLIIFMVVTPLLDKDIEIAIPKTEKVEDEQDVPEDQLLVRLFENGDLTLNDHKMTFEEYSKALEKQMAIRTEQAKIIFVQADDGASYGQMVKAIDLAKGAGVQIIGMSTEAQLPAAP